MKMSNCNNYVEDGAICDDGGNPKGQCANCGDKWFRHWNFALPEDELLGIDNIRNYQDMLEKIGEK